MDFSHRIEPPPSPSILQMLYRTMLEDKYGDKLKRRHHKVTKVLGGFTRPGTNLAQAAAGVIHPRSNWDFCKGEMYWIR